MIKEPKNIDFYTTGRQPSEKEFACISEWIKKDKERKKIRQLKADRKKVVSPESK
jgi:Zn-dependent M16 (insulinase) family peptidase